MRKIRFFKKDTLIIAKKVITSSNSFIQIKNITRIWHGRPDIEIPYFRICIMFLLGETIRNYIVFLSILIYIFALSVCAYYIYATLQYTLNFELSSGQVYAFTSNKEFIIDSYSKVKEIIGNVTINEEQYVFNFDSCKLNIVNGDKNEVVNGENVVFNKGNNNTIQVNQTDNSQKHEIINSFNESTVINYSNINKELEDLIGLLDETADDKDIKLLKEAQKMAKNKDEEGIKTTLRKLSKNVFEIIEKTTTFIALIDFISKFII